MGPLAFVFVVLAIVPSGLLVPLLVWARWLRQHAAAPSLAAWTAYGVLSLGAAATIFGSLAGGLVTLDAMSRAGSPADRSRLLASGISELLWNQAVTMLVAILAALWLLFATWRWHWGRR